MNSQLKHPIIDTEENLTQLLNLSRKNKKKRNIIISNSENRKKYNRFKNNKVTSTKYNLLSWLPRSILMQFKRIANIYFLVISILNFFYFSPKVNS